MANSGLKSLFLGPDNRLRYFWRAALFFVLGNYIALPVTYRIIARFAGDELTARNIFLGELALFTGALACTYLLALYEGKRVDSYGLPVRLALGPRTWEGAGAGIVMAGAVAIGMYALGGMQVHGLATTGGALWLSAVAWLGANIAIGVAEEFWYRSYFLQSLWRSLGFWPGALIIALIFTSDHYFYKTGENIWDVITLMSLSLLMCYSVLRTGTLWFAVGFHVAFDYMQLFVIGTPNGAQVPVGRLLDVSFSGPAWLTGGVLGTEASFLMYPMIALLWLYVWWRFRPAALSPAAGPASSASADSADRYAATRITDRT